MMGEWWMSVSGELGESRGDGRAADDDEAVMARRGRVLRLGTKGCLKGERSMMFGVVEVEVEGKDSGKPIEIE
jgi:hypothetical protein